ncbi:MAG: hypothetical protein CM15mV22_0560 [Eurybiavirus sp.]|nr:MAG: hypothetical protein CM15mV22_0560 [Eurybiavirus sp.]
MKKLLVLLAVGGMGSPAFADITHKMQSSVSLTTNAAATQVERIGSPIRLWIRCHNGRWWW